MLLLFFLLPLLLLPKWWLRPLHKYLLNYWWPGAGCLLLSSVLFKLPFSEVCMGFLRKRPQTTQSWRAAWATWSVPSIPGDAGTHLSSPSGHLVGLILQSRSWFIWAKVFSWLQQDLFLWYFLAWCTTCPISLTRQWQQDTYKLLLTNVSRNQQTFLKEPESKYFRLAGRVVRVVTMKYSVAVVLTAIGNGHGCVTIMFYFQKLYGGSYLAYGW